MQDALEVRYVLPRSGRRTRNPPLLFVHGAYCDAWCWEVNMLPWFAALALVFGWVTWSDEQIAAILAAYTALVAVVTTVVRSKVSPVA